MTFNIKFNSKIYYTQHLKQKWKKANVCALFIQLERIFNAQNEYKTTSFPFPLTFDAACDFYLVWS